MKGWDADVRVKGFANLGPLKSLGGPNKRINIYHLGGWGPSMF